MTLHVIDWGPGLTDEARQRMFDPFFSTKEDGMGIGLSFSKNIVEQFGGDLWARDGDRRGTQFCLSLPASNLVVS